MPTSIAVKTQTRDALERIKREIRARSLDTTISTLIEGRTGLGTETGRTAHRLEKLLQARPVLAEYAKKNGIKSIALFGSTLHGDARPDSDIDLLVRFSPRRRVGFLEMARLEREISELLGSHVDMQTPDSLSKYFRDEVLKEALPLYGET